MSKLKVSFWRPNNGRGSACIIDFNNRDKTLWINMMPEGGQDGKKFDRNRQITAKLGVADVGELLAVLNGRKEGLGTKNDKYWSGIIHKIRGSDDSTIVGFQPTQNGYSLSLSAKRNGGEAQRLSVSIGMGDMEILRVFLNTVLPEMLSGPEVETEGQ